MKSTFFLPQTSQNRILPMCFSARAIGLLALLLLPAAMQAQFTYTSENNAITITRYTGSNGSLTVPETIDGLPVTRIGDYAFLGCTSLINVTIGDSVTDIGYSAFSSCTNLTSATIGNSVTRVGDRAFLYCASLTNILIPNSVTSIGDYAFFSCTNLIHITIPNGVTRIGDSAFYACTSLTRVTIGDNVASIGYAAFSSCRSLTNITIPNGVTRIGDSAFYACSSLTRVTIPNGVTSIGDGAFYACTRVTSATIPSSVISIGDGAFGSCTSLTGVYLLGDAPKANPYTFIYADRATIYYLPGTAGWSPTFAGRPTVLWNPQVRTSDATFGVLTNGFGFTLTGSSNLVIVVESCTNLANPEWFPVGTNTLTGGSSYFRDPHWANYPARFYRLSLP